jgi:hypothetical protein
MIDWPSALGGAAAGFVGGLAGGFSLKSVITVRRSASVNQSSTNDRMGNVVQRDNQAGGSIAGRDINQSK